MTTISRAAATAAVTDDRLRGRPEPSTRRSLARGLERKRRLADLGRLFLAAGEAGAAALHGGEELLEVDLERREDLVGVVLGAEADLALGLPRVLDDLLGSALGLLVDLLVGDQARLLVACLLDDPLGLALGLREHLLALLDDPARLLDLLGDRGTHLIEEVVDLLAIHANLVRERHGPGVVDQIVQLVYEDQNVHERSLKLRECAFWGRAGVPSTGPCKLLPRRRPRSRWLGATC